MDKGRKRSITRACAAAACVIIVLCVGSLLTDYIVARVLTPRDDKRHAALQEEIKLDATLAPKLAADQKAVTERRLARKARGTVIAYILIVSAALFLGCSAWLAGQGARRPPAMHKPAPARPRLAPAEGRFVFQRRAIEIRIGVGACGIAKGAEPVCAVLEQAAQEAGVRGIVRRVGCNGMCYCEPLIEVVEAGGRSAFYGNVTPEAARCIARGHIRPRRPSAWARWSAEWLAGRFSRDGRSLDLRQYRLELPARYLAGQQRISLENCGRIDPSSIADYIARDGYRALERCIGSLTPAAVSAEISSLGLSTGTVPPVRLVVTDGDGEDPRAFGGRLLLESDPHRVLEGIAIAAYATGASEACLYVRKGRSLALERAREAIRQAEERGFLGTNILSSEFSLRVQVSEGAVAQGHAVETLASVAWIARHGQRAYDGGRTKLLSLAGKIKYAGLVEVPVGTTIRRVVEGIGGGTKSGRPLKAVQLGGPSGALIPADLADTPIDRDSVAGAGLGSGSLVVFDDRDCMVETARQAGRSLPAGAKPVLEILDRITKGNGLPGDLEQLETAQSPVASALRYFRDEFEMHVVERRCPAGRCRALIRYVVNDNCIGCTLCAQVCPAGAIEFRPYLKHEVAVELCTLCDKCWQACQQDAIGIVAAEHGRADD